MATCYLNMRAFGLWAMLTWACSASQGELGRPSQANTDVALDYAPEHYYNPSLVTYGMETICAIKTTEFRKIKSKIWWMNSIQMCRGATADHTAMRCEPFMPWSSGLDECELDSRVRGGKVDSAGIGDTKLWLWPGKGVYAIFGHKPQRRLTSDGVKERYCTAQLIYHQWLVQVSADPGQRSDDPWRLLGRDPLPLQPDPSHHAYPTTQPYVLEKNWMPWIYQDPDTGNQRVMVTYMVMPHTVWELMPSGAAIPRWESSNAQLFDKFAAFDVHGGPPVVWVPPDLTPGEEGYYLGVMHHIERWQRGSRLYRHFAFKFQAVPPFKTFAISDELPLKNNVFHKGRTSRIAFACGLYLNEDTATLHLTYGAADNYARLLSLSLDALESLFTGSIAFRDIDDSPTEMLGASSGSGAAAVITHTHMSSSTTNTLVRSSSSLVQERIVQEERHKSQQPNKEDRKGALQSGETAAVIEEEEMAEAVVDLERIEEALLLSSGEADTVLHNDEQLGTSQYDVGLEHIMSMVDGATA